MLTRSLLEADSLRVNMLRNLGIALLIVASLIAGQRVFVPFDLQVGSRFDGQDVIAITMRCGRAAPILLSPDTEMADLGPNFAGDCTKAARTRALESAGVLALGIAAFSFLTLGKIGRVEPMSDSLRPLPEVDGEVFGRGWSPGDRGDT